MANDGGVWVKLEDAGSSAPGAAVINDAASNYDNKDAGVTIDGKTYDIYTFTTPTTTRSMRLTDEAQARITDEDLLMAVATTELPDDFTGDPATLFDRKYRSQLRNAFEITPAVDPGLLLTVAEPGGFADVLVVGAGGHGAGGAGGASGGGGGAGGLIEARVFLEQGNNAVKVGGSPNYYGYAANGEASFIGNYIAPGGGVGCNGTYSTSGNGGSGGGGKATFAGDSLQGLGTPGFGHDGDKTMPTVGGGGGAGGPGVGATGGPGKDVYITGEKMTLAAGGDGNGPLVVNTAPANSGNGGTTYSQGGSGIVIVRVEI